MDFKEISVWRIKMPLIIIFIVTWLSLSYSTIITITTQDPRYLGCVVAQKQRDWRVLPDDPGLSSTTMTINKCLRHCQGGGWSYAGLEEDHCSCGNFDRNYTIWGKLTDDHCDKNCVGNSNEKCGGKNATSIFRVCKNHKFGAECKSDCHCGTERGSECNPIKGTCRGGDKRCQRAWTDWPHCQMSCIQGPNDLNCTGECHCLPGVSCDHNGECDESKGRRCPAGYREFPKCLKCGRFTYGEGCQPCPRCEGRECHHVTGACDEFCPHGTYGSDCKFNCTGHCGNNVTCSPTDGTCPEAEGCQKGYEGARCEIRITPNPSEATTMKVQIAVVIIGIASLTILLVEDLGC